MSLPTSKLKIRFWFVNSRTSLRSTSTSPVAVEPVVSPAMGEVMAGSDVVDATAAAAAAAASSVSSSSIASAACMASASPLSDASGAPSVPATVGDLDTISPGRCPPSGASVTISVIPLPPGGAPDGAPTSTPDAPAVPPGGAPDGASTSTLEGPVVPTSTPAMGPAINFASATCAWWMICSVSNMALIPSLMLLSMACLSTLFFSIILFFSC